MAKVFEKECEYCHHTFTTEDPKQTVCNTCIEVYGPALTPKPQTERCCEDYEMEEDKHEHMHPAGSH